MYNFIITILLSSSLLLRHLFNLLYFIDFLVSCNGSYIVTTICSHRKRVEVSRGLYFVLKKLYQIFSEPRTGIPPTFLGTGTLRTVYYSESEGRLFDKDVTSDTSKSCFTARLYNWEVYSLVRGRRFVYSGKVFTFMSIGNLRVKTEIKRLVFSYFRKKRIYLILDTWNAVSLEEPLKLRLL